jgi:hypothetical protein
MGARFDKAFADLSNDAATLVGKIGSSAVPTPGHDEL